MFSSKKLSFLEWVSDSFVSRFIADFEVEINVTDAMSEKGIESVGSKGV
jgi:hypothetical protein